MLGGETLVMGVALQGHEYRGGCRGGASVVAGAEVVLTGCTAPWNTCALWDVPKLALTGFLLVSEGLHPEESDDDNGGATGTSHLAAGLDDVATIAVLQRILSPYSAQAKLVALPGMVSWEEDFGNNPRRRGGNGTGGRWRASLL